MNHAVVCKFFAFWSRTVLGSSAISAFKASETVCPTEGMNDADWMMPMLCNRHKNSICRAFCWYLTKTLRLALTVTDPFSTSCAMQFKWFYDHTRGSESHHSLAQRCEYFMLLSIPSLFIVAAWHERPQREIKEQLDSVVPILWHMHQGSIQWRVPRTTTFLRGNTSYSIAVLKCIGLTWPNKMT